MISSEARDLERQFRELRADSSEHFCLETERENVSQAHELTAIPDQVVFEDEFLGGVPVLRAIPACDRGIFNIVMIHGGAFCLMSAHTHHRVAGHIANACQSQVIAPDYSLAPECPYPTALNECIAVIQAALDERDDGYTALIGDSAGGGLALSAALKLRDLGSTLPVSIVLFSPWLDLTLASPSVDKLEHKDPMLRKRNLSEMAKMYVGEADPKHPYLSPLLGSHEHLPPLYVRASGLDLLRDDGFRLREAYHLQGLDLHLQFDADMLHCVQFFAGNVPEADAAIADAAEFLEGCVIATQQAPGYQT